MATVERARRRRRTAVLAAASVLSVAAAAVLVTGAPTSSPASWESAWVLSPASRTLMVRAVGQDGIAGACGPPQVRLRVEESRTSVRVGARSVRFTGGVPFVRGLPYFGAVGCGDVGYGPESHSIGLSAPLGARRVVDARTGRSGQVLVGTRSSTITGLPRGLSTTDLAVDTWPDGVRSVRRTWRSSAGGQFVLLQVATTAGASSRLFGGRTVRANGITVLMSGHTGHPRDVYSFQWRTTEGRQVNVDLHLTHGIWTAAQALDVVTRTTRVV